MMAELFVANLGTIAYVFCVFYTIFRISCPFESLRQS